MRRILAKLSPRRRRLQVMTELQRAGRLEVGNGTYGAPDIKTFAGDSTRLTIGNYCSIAAGVTFILGGNHPSDRISTYPFRERFNLPGKWKDGFPSTRGDIVIGHDVWIGTECLILSGVTVGSGAILASRSVVTRDVPPYAVVAGSPARVVRSRLDEASISALLALKWWSWPEERILRNAALLNDPIRTKDAIDALILAQD